jgi:hypothetical protein
VGLVGGRSLGQLDWSLIAQGCDAFRSSGQVLDPLLRSVEGVAMLTLGPLPEPGAGPLNTLGNAWLEWDAGRNIFGLQSPWFVGVPWASYARGVHQKGARLLPEARQSAHDSGQFFLTLDLAATSRLPAVDELKAQIAHRLPVSVREDRTAEWRQWPSRVKPTPQR